MNSLPQSPTPQQSETESWAQQLSSSLMSVADLKMAGLLSEREATRLAAVGDAYKIRITPYYASLMTHSPDCPIRLQAIPALGEEDPELPAEIQALSQEIYGRPNPWTPDPIGDLSHMTVPRLTHRYGDRALLHLSSTCAVYCRFCFRKSHLNDAERTLYEGTLDPALEYLERTPQIRELILTGGDPLAVTETVLDRLLQRLSKISHLKTVRIHSRMAVTLPARLNDSLAKVLEREWPFRIHLVSHFNHPRELTAVARQGLRRMARAGVTLLNQTVLLRRVNDSVDCLAELFHGLYEAGVLPFYLHHPDWTPGTFHFRVSIEEGQHLARQLRGRIPGPALPHYVLDIPGGHGKIPLLDSAVVHLDTFVSVSVSASATTRIQAAVYQLESPHSRTRTPGQKLKYLDLTPLQL